MKLKTLLGVEAIAGFPVVVMDELKSKYPEMFNPDGSMIQEIFNKEIRPKKFIYIRHDIGSISFQMQEGNIGDNGINGCQYDSLIETARIIIQNLNAYIPCRENSMAITKLDEALMWINKRKEDRVKRGVEGKDLA